ncbi:MAG: YccF domain-containing protein [Actinobacteria bacterium]|nr:YccF domain-containing protein [Actinomycetota bacterium]
MRTIGNILWLVFAGIWMFFAYVIAGIIMCVLIITIPFGIASFRIAGYALWPFGRTVVSKPTSGVLAGIGNVIWFIFAGLWIAIGHIITGVILCIFIITIPFGIASFKMAGLALFPLGKSIVPIDQDPSGQYAVRPIGT